MSVEDIRKVMQALHEPPCSSGGQPLRGHTYGGCHTCHNRVKEELIERTGDQMLRFTSVFIVCNDCGNKRCPRAIWHGYECHRSNDVDQKPAGDPPPEMILAQNAVPMIRELLVEIERK